MFKPDVTVNEAIGILKDIDKQLKLRNTIEIARIRNVLYADGVHSKEGVEMDDTEFHEFLGAVWNEVVE